MKKALSAFMTLLMAASAVPTVGVCAAQTALGAPTAFKNNEALYVHAVSNSADTEAWQEWQSVHDEDFYEADKSTKYFFLPSSAGETSVDIYNAFNADVVVNGVTVPSKQTKAVSYSVDDAYKVTAAGGTYTLKFMKSNAEAAIYINNSNADGSGTDLMSYLNVDKSRKAKATGAIVEPDGKIDNTPIKKIKGRGNTTWDKPKKAYNITYDSKVSIAGMAKNKKYSILANYQDDSLSRNRFLYDLSDAVGMPYSSDSRYVDFYVNGFYWGSYQMTEKIEAGSLVTDVDEDAYLNEDGTVKGDFSFIAEVDAGAKDGDDYYVQLSNGVKITIKAPELEQGDAGYNEVKSYVKEKFEAFANAAKSVSGDVAKYADIDSVTKLYLINELGKNWDAGVSSLFFTYKPDADGTYKFFGSPVWDYDNSLGNCVGVRGELRNIGVSDYEQYTGWWCKYKGRSTNSRNSANIMNGIARNKQVLAAAPKIWFEQFVPALNHFAGKATSEAVGAELYTADKYFSLIKDSAEMNYKSGWLLDTGDWISDHSRLANASFNMADQSYSVDSSAAKYNQNFEGMFNYARDWMLSRGAWLSEQMKKDYDFTPKVTVGDVNGDGKINLIDRVYLTRHLANWQEYSEINVSAADVNGDGAVNILDRMVLTRYIACWGGYEVLPKK